MLYVMIDNVCVLFAGRVFQQTVGMPMGIDCYPLLTYLLLHSYEANVIQGLFHEKRKELTLLLNFTLHYIDEVILLYNSSKIVDIKKSLKILNGFLE